MNGNELIISAAGSGKTTFIINDALQKQDDPILISTYTEANKNEIINKIIKKKGYIPANITIQSWFSFLLQHGVRPYQNALSDDLNNERVGFLLTNEKSGVKYYYRGSPRYYKEKDIIHYYFSKEMKIYSDKVTKFIHKSNEVVNGAIIERISHLFKHIYIDEVQDIAGWDLEILKCLFNTDSHVTLVGDPRQVVYLTNISSKHKQYKDGNIIEFIKEKCPHNSCTIDQETLKKSHRNHKDICAYSSSLFENFEPSESCDCEECNHLESPHAGVYLICKDDTEKYCRTYNPVVLRWSGAEQPEWNFGKSKGLTFDRVLLYPTENILKWMKDHNYNLKYQSRCKFYVALTRARYSVGIVVNSNDLTKIKNVKIFRSH